MTDKKTVNKEIKRIVQFTSQLRHTVTSLENRLKPILDDPEEEVDVDGQWINLDEPDVVKKLKKISDQLDESLIRLVILQDRIQL